MWVSRDNMGLRRERSNRVVRLVLPGHVRIGSMSGGPECEQLLRLRDGVCNTGVP